MRRRAQMAAQPTRRPIAAPPSATPRNFNPALPRANVPDTAAPRAIL